MTSRQFLTCTLALIVLLCPASAQTFTVIGLPDTQNYSERFPAIFYQQTQWVADNLQTLDIRFVSHYGDLVQNGDQLNEWSVADGAMRTLDLAGVPWGSTAGNHDITPTGTSGQPYIPTNYRTLFGPSRFSGKDWYRGASPSGMSSYQVFFAAGLEWLALHVEVSASMRELTWAQAVLDDHRHLPVLFTTHRYLQDAEDYTAGVPVVPSGRYPSIWYAIEGVYVPGGTQSNDIFDWFVRRNPNIIMVQCGHFHEEFRQTSSNVLGNPVYEILADYQDDPNGGDGWLRIMTFDVGGGFIDFDSYSPFLNQTRTADESRFSLPVNFDDYFEALPTTILQEGVGGYQGTRDTWLSQENGNRNHAGSNVLVVDDDTENSFFSDDRAQGLIRFDGIANAIPAGAAVVSAALTIQVTDDIDNPLYDPDFDLHRVLIPWNENSTWNSLGSGLQTGTELGPRIVRFDGDNDPDGDGLRRLDVTATVQDWVNGAPNFGFAILPEIIGGNDDGIEIASSENGNPLFRPRLEIVWDDGTGYRTYGEGIDPANTLRMRGIGFPRPGGKVDVSITGITGPSLVAGFSTTQAQIPLSTGTLLVDPLSLVAFTTLPVDQAGVARWEIPLPNDPALVGARGFFQAYASAPGTPGGIALSNGLEIVITR